MSDLYQVRGGGVASWSIRHLIGVMMLALAVVILGLFALDRLSVDLLPHIIYPEVRVRIVDPGVPARIMEDRVTRQLEEQLAITEDAVVVRSRSASGSSQVDLSFEYGKDIDVALRDASTRLDRSKRFLPDTINPPIIYKRDPSQIPVAEFVVASEELDNVALREWVDYDFAKQFLNLPGVAAVEVGGGVNREVQVLPDIARLSAIGLGVDELINALRYGNVDLPTGRLALAGQELGGRTAARFTSVAAIQELPLMLQDGRVIPLREVAQVIDSHADERLMVRIDDVPGVKISIQKQPSANTVNVVDVVKERLAWLKTQKLLPADVVVRNVADQSVYVRNSLNNAVRAGLSGTLLAMVVVYLFLGNLRRTLIIGSAIPLAVMVTFVAMGVGGLTFNIMTLGGLALGVGMLVDNTIVMMENIQRHQQLGERDQVAGERAAREIYSAIVAATSTNLAAVLPFLFVGGLAGLLFRELIFTISAAIVASLVVALTLVPALTVHIHDSQRTIMRRAIDQVVSRLQRGYAFLVRILLRHLWLQIVIVAALIGGIIWSVPAFFEGRQVFLPDMDDGLVNIHVTADPGTQLNEMDTIVRRLEALFQSQPETESVYSLVGGWIFGRTQVEVSNRSSIKVQLKPLRERQISSRDWIKRVQGEVAKLRLVGVQVWMRARGIRGIRTSSGDDDINLRVQGPDLDTLTRVGDQVVDALRDVEGIDNLQHSAEEVRMELAIVVDRQRLAALGFAPEAVGEAVNRAVEGEVVTDYLEGDRAFNVRLRLPRRQLTSPRSLEELLLFNAHGQGVRLGEVAKLSLVAEPSTIRRESQRRIVEINASLTGEVSAGKVFQSIHAQIAKLQLPDGYAVYDGGEYQSLQQGRETGRLLIALAIFLVFVVMAVQYESLRNPLVIIISIPFAVIGVAVALRYLELPLSMPVWLGMIMLTGIVVNNAIVLVEYIGLERERGLERDAAIIEAARLRLRPILMTTLTTVMGMMPLAVGWGEGAEMLEPLAISLIAGLLTSLLVTLLLIPVVYRWLHHA